MKAAVSSLAFEQTDGFDPGRLFIQRVPAMVEQARDSAENDAHSYRGFKVGAAALAYNPHNRDAAVLSAGNLKTREDKPKHCAEKRVLQLAKKTGLTVVGGLVVVGTTDKQAISEVTEAETRTLHPCAECRQLFCEHPLMRKDSLVLSTGIDEDVYQVHTSQELSELYGGDHSVLPEDLPTRFGFEQWEQHLVTYDRLTAAEATLPVSQRRGMAQLVQMALLTPPRLT